MEAMTSSVILHTQLSIQSIRNAAQAPPQADEVPLTKPKADKKPFRRQVSIWVRASSTLFGVILCIFCAMAYSTNSLVAKLLMTTGQVSPYFVTFSKQFFVGLFILPIAKANNVSLIHSKPLKNHWRAMTLRCVFGSSSLIYFVALYYAPLSDVGVIFTSMLPIFSSILSRIFFKELFHYTDAFFMLSTFAGVVMILRPPLIFPPDLASAIDGGVTLSQRMIGGGMALVAAFFQSIAILSVRSLSKDLHYSAIVFWNSVVGTCVALVVMLVVDGVESPVTYIGRAGIVFAASAGLVAQASTTLAVRYISPVIASLSSSIELAFLFFYQIIFLGVYPHYFSVIGSCIIVFLMVVLVLRSLLIDKLKQCIESSGELFSPDSKYHKIFMVLTK